MAEIAEPPTIVPGEKIGAEIEIPVQKEDYVSLAKMV